MVRRTKAESDETRRSIIAAARQIFAEHGVSRTSLEQVARAAGVTRGAVYWHFSNKVDLFVAVRNELAMPMLERFERELCLEGCPDPLGTLETFLHAHIEKLAHDEAVRQTFEVMLTKCEYVGEFGDQLRQFSCKAHDIRLNIQRAYERAATLGLLAEGLDPALLARDTHAFLTGLIRLWIIDYQGELVRTQASALVAQHVALRRRARTAPCPMPLP